MRSGTIFCGLSYSKFLHAPDRLNANLLSSPKGRRFYLLPSPSQVFIDLATCIVWVCLNGSAKYCGDQMPSIPGIRLGIWYQMLSVASFLCTIQKLQRIIDCHMFCVSRLDTGQISLDAPASLEELFVIDWLCVNWSGWYFWDARAAWGCFWRLTPWGIRSDWSQLTILAQP